LKRSVAFHCDNTVCDHEVNRNGRAVPWLLSGCGCRNRNRGRMGFIAAPRTDESSRRTSRRANLHLAAVSATAAQFLIHSRTTILSLMPLQPKTSLRRWFGKNSDNSSLPTEAVAPREIDEAGTRSAYQLYGANTHIDQTDPGVCNAKFQDRPEEIDGASRSI